ncbi:MAG: histidine kinase [Rhizobiaceae bacterium]|nr:histidine kinase [Rhizobiaceae bacterium]
MPSLFRFLTVIAILVGLAYAAMFALAEFVTPNQVEISDRVPLDLPPAGQPATAP